MGILVCTGGAAAQQSADAPTPPADQSSNDAIREMRRQIQELQTAVVEMRSEAQRSRAETMELRRELDAVRAASGTSGSTTPAARNEAGETTAAAVLPVAAAQAVQDTPSHTASAEEEYELLSGKVDEQYQTKVESASKYRVRLSGIVLLNLFSNRGTVDNIDLPDLAYGAQPGSSGGSFGATLRQSEIGLEVFGPRVAGARTTADLQLDLAGGFSRAENGVNSGLLRLRTATMRMDWANTSVVAGQDGLFFSPGSPTSFATLAVPALSYTGNLWSWVPQIRVEHRWTVREGASFVLQGGILDPLSGEPPILTGTGYRQPVAGERSRQPAYGTRIGWTQSVFGLPMRVGVGSYYSRQDYGFNRTVDGWAGTADWDLPLSHRFSLSGKFYRGRGAGGIGGGIGRSVLLNGSLSDDSTAVRALNAVGGWAQLKYRPASKLEFNAAFGDDNSYAADVRAFPAPVAFGDPSLLRNQGSLANVIYRPRSDLLFSAEYRHLRTYTIDDASYAADHINFMMGVLF